MDKEKTKDLIKIMQASLEGEVIECKLRSQNPLSKWFTHSGDSWNSDKYMYRIQPKPQYRPFRDGNECWEEMKRRRKIERRDKEKRKRTKKKVPFLWREEEEGPPSGLTDQMLLFCCVFLFFKFIFLEFF